jgi:hypothetical protein
VDLQYSNCEWGVLLPADFRPKSLKLLAQPEDGDSRCGERKVRARKAVVLLSSEEDHKGTITFRMLQFQVIPSFKRQTSGSYNEQNPYTVLSRQCSVGEISKALDGSSIACVFLAGASFQFDLIHKSPNEPTSRVKEIVGTIGVLRSPGIGLEAIAVTSTGASQATLLSNFGEPENNTQNLKKTLKSSEISAYWLADVVKGRQSVITKYGENATIDFFVWTLQQADGELLCWFVPCLEFHAFPSEVGGMIAHLKDALLSSIIGWFTSNADIVFLIFRLRLAKIQRFPMHSPAV